MLEKKIEKLAETTDGLIEVIKELIVKLETGEVTVKPSARTPAKKAPAEQEEPKAAVKKDNIKPLKKEPPKEEATVDKDDVREKLLKIKEDFGSDVMFGVLADFADGARNMSEVKVEHYQPIFDACEAKLNEFAEAA